MLKYIAYLFIITVIIALTACQDSGTTALEKSTIVQGQPDEMLSGMKASTVVNFRTHLSGDQEVPAVDTKAQGQAIFQVSEDGQSISYKLIVANIENVFMSHIHLAPKGENGPVAVWLYPVGGPPTQLIEGRFSGVLAEGVITADDLVGPLADGSLEDLIEEVKSGGAYVNVHTSQNRAGEVRGQIF